MSTAVFLNIHADTYARFAHIRAQLLQGHKESQASALGDVLSEMACEVIEQFLWCCYRKTSIIPKQANPKR